MNTLNKQVLVSLYELAQLDVPASVQTVALHLGVSRREAASSLNALSEAGLVRAETLRLTFFGLMKATGLRHRQQRSHAA
jgi:Mn-dependent DtxR family transcriptional regulator